MKILVVEDEHKIRDLLEITLSEKGFTVVCAKNGEEGLQKFEQELPDILLTDAMLPRIDGFELIEKVRATSHGESLPIIMMSAVYKDVEIQADAMKKYHIDFIVKPFSLIELLKVIAEASPSASALLKDQKQPKPKEDSVSYHVLEGDIEHFSVPLLLVNFFSEQKTGILVLNANFRGTKIYIENGLPVFAESKIRKEDSVHVTDLLKKAFGCVSGKYQFYQYEMLDADIPRYQYDFYGLIFEGARKYYRLDLLVGQFQKYQDCKVTRDITYFEKIKFIEFTPEEQSILMKIDDERTVGDLVSEAKDHMENVFQILWVLHFMDLICFEVSD